MTDLQEYLEKNTARRSCYISYKPSGNAKEWIANTQVYEWYNHDDEVICSKHTPLAGNSDCDFWVHADTYTMDKWGDKYSQKYYAVHYKDKPPEITTIDLLIERTLLMKEFGYYIYSNNDEHWILPGHYVNTERDERNKLTELIIGCLSSNTTDNKRVEYYLADRFVYDERGRLCSQKKYKLIPDSHLNASAYNPIEVHSYEYNGKNEITTFEVIYPSGRFFTLDKKIMGIRYEQILWYTDCKKQPSAWIKQILHSDNIWRPAYKRSHEQPNTMEDVIITEKWDRNKNVWLPWMKELRISDTNGNTISEGSISSHNNMPMENLSISIISMTLTVI